jgi:hypothetical protein
LIVQASAGCDGTVRIWNPEEEKKEVQCLKLMSTSVETLVFFANYLIGFI